MNLIGWKVVFYFDSISVENLSADSCLRKSGTYMLVLKTAVFKGNFHTDSFKSEAIFGFIGHYSETFFREDLRKLAH